jgi:DNA mismatch repair protein MutL
MGKIRVLPDTVADRIAAGEVVERPASVVKELVENALDAGARSVRVSIEKGGRRAIVVEDDGAGMDRDDALLALERHATSKVRRAEDLTGVATLGFRGEALPSIASVSLFTLTTAADDSGEACRVVVRGGSVRSVDTVSRPVGTTVEVRNLFFNTPARKKFLRSDSTETQRLVEVVSALALARHEVRFSLDSETRSLLAAPATADLGARICQVAGTELFDRLLTVSAKGESGRLEGFVAPPGESRASGLALYFWINGRPVRDRVLRHAVVDAYAESLPRGRYPVAFIGLELDPAQVDVNVHPAKTEVRFVRSGHVHDLVRDAVREAVRASGGYGRAPSTWTRPPGEVGDAGGAPSPSQSELPPLREGWARPAGSVATPGGGRDVDLEGPATAFALAQYRNCYILGRDEQGLLLVDQHTAHERILYEELLDATAAGPAERQTLLFPVTVELGPGEPVVLEEHCDALERTGFGLEGFGGETVVVREVPGGCPAGEVSALVRDLVQALREGGPPRGPDEARQRAAATAACHAAVKINDPLTPEKMDYILGGVLRCRTPTHCPHGRPVMLRITLDEIERAFGRTWGPR